MLSRFSRFNNSTLHAIVLASLLMLAAGGANAQQSAYRSVPDSLVHAFTRLWDSLDVDAMFAMLTRDAVWMSPFQSWVGRDTMRTTVLVTNPPSFRDNRTVEHFSSVSGDHAYSIGELRFSGYDSEGQPTGKHYRADYLFTFIKEMHGPWRVQLLIFRNEREESESGRG